MTVASELDFPTTEFCDAVGDFLLELDEGEDVHEGGTIGIIAAEADVHVEVGDIIVFSDAAPNALEAGGVIAVVVVPDFPYNGLCPPSEPCFGELLADGFDLINGGECGGVVVEESLVVGVFPSVVGGVVFVSDPVIFDAVADFHDVFLEVFESSGHVEVNHGFLEGVVNDDEHGGVFAGWVAGFVVLGADVATIVVQFEQRVFPGFGDAVLFGYEYGDAGHVLFSSWGFGWIVTFWWC